MSLVVLAALAVPALAAGRSAPGLPARVVDYDPPRRVEAYPVTDFGRGPGARDDRTGKARWRVVERTGNCCENYVTTTAGGRLLDFGGRYINFTDDLGRTWKQVQPLEPLINGEGAIVAAPGGDVVGVEWDPYSGDHLLAFKYDAATEEWQYNEMPIHTPFYDREWIAVVPGPFTVLGQEVPYVTFVRGGWPSKEAWLYSLDGLTYVHASTTFVDQLLTTAQQGSLRPGRSPSLDWIQPNTNTGITPLGKGVALAQPDFFAESWSVLDPQALRWSSFAFPDGMEPQGRHLADSKGRLHNLREHGRRFSYAISTDGGRSWRSITVPLPEDHVIEEIDFRANAAAGIAAVGIHSHDGKGAADQDLLYKIDITSATPRLIRLYEVGLGDVDGSAGVGADIRFDFESVAILRDGRVAVSFYDTTTEGVYHLAEAVRERIGPALAIELDTSLSR